jgi:phosphoglycolate phosphatase
MKFNSEIFSETKTIFFDFDGTLHNSLKIYKPAFEKAYDYLVENAQLEKKIWSDEEISFWLGFSSKDMWKEFQPNLDINLKNIASKLIGKEMMNQLDKNLASLYESTEEVLEYLKKKNYDLVFVSNCSLTYKNKVKDYFKLNRFFTELYSSEEFNFIPKYQILSLVKSKYDSPMVIVGDRFQDLEAGQKNNIHTIGCVYGYGRENELEKADLLIKDIRELKDIF